MKHLVTLILTPFILIIWLSDIAAAVNHTKGPDGINVLPVDSPKKEQVPPPQMLTFPVFSDISKIRLNSYSQVRYQYYFDDKTASSFDIRNARMILNGSPIRNLSYRLQVDFAPPTVRALDAYAAYTFNAYLKLTAGQQKFPVSYESLRIDYDVRSVSRSQVVEALTSRSKDVLAGTTAVNNNGRDIGLLLSGGIPNASTQSTASPGNWGDYSLGIFNGNGINKGDADKRKDFGARVVVHPVKNLGIGGSIYNGKATYNNGIATTDTPAVRNRFGFDASYEDGKRFYAAAEYLNGTDDTITKSGYYALVEGFIFPKKLSVLAKYDFFDPNDEKDDDANTIYSFGVNYYFAAFTKLQLQYDYRHENAPAQKKNDLLSIQMQIYF